MPVDMVLVISYNRIFEHTRGYERIVNIKLKYNDINNINNIRENRKQYSCLEMFRTWYVY
jgi:hypothetical protein